MAWDKTIPQKEAVKSFLSFEEGEINVEASVEKYRTACQQYKAGQLAENELIASCMSLVFDWHKGTTLNLDFIRSQTISHMTKRHPELGSPATFAMVSKRVEDYLQDNCNQEATEATAKRPAKEAITGRIYGRKYGRNAGFYRVADQVVEETSTAK